MDNENQTVNFGELEFKVIETDKKRKIPSTHKLNMVFTGETISEVMALTTWETLVSRVRRKLKLKDADIYLLSIGDHTAIGKTQYDARKH